MRVFLAGLLFCCGCSTVSVGHPGFEGGRFAEVLDEASRDSGPEGLSGISRIDGSRYFCVDDRNGLLHELEIPLGADGAIASCSLKRSVRLEGRVDLEGIAYDPQNGRVWVADEHDATVVAFDPETGREATRAAVPALYRRNAQPNRSLEGLSISPDGLRMYISNEDTLRGDGRPADELRGGTVRIQEFVREGTNAKWVPTHQYRYGTDRVEGSRFKGHSFSGVSALCAPGDGTLLVLERELSQKGPFFPSFRARLYEFDLVDEQPVASKRLVWEGNTRFANYEGLCLGPVLEDGTRTLVLVSDGGNGADGKVLVLALRGGK